MHRLSFIVTVSLSASCLSIDPNRRALLDSERSQAVGEINAKPGISWRAGVNPRFTGLPIGSAQALCGVKLGGKQRLQELVGRGAVEFVPRQLATVVPERFESCEKWPQCAAVISNVRDQSACGCCWAFGAAEAASDRLCIYTNGTVAVPLSTQELCFCAEAEGCNGGTLELAWNYIQTRGIVTGTEYQNSGPFGSFGLCSSFSLSHCHHHGPRDVDPYPPVGSPGCQKVHHSPECPRSCDSTSQMPYSDFLNDRYHFRGALQYLDWDADLIASQIMLHGPVEAAFTVYEDFEHYVSGIYHATSIKELGGHAVKIVGWGAEGGVKYWRVLNSWNQYWGEDGHFRIRRGTNECGIEEQVVVSAATSTWVGPGIIPEPPMPPIPGNCWQQETPQACTATVQDGARCEWCKHGSICQDSPCLPSVKNNSNIVVV